MGGDKRHTKYRKSIKFSPRLEKAYIVKMLGAMVRKYLMLTRGRLFLVS